MTSTITFSKIKKFLSIDASNPKISGRTGRIPAGPAVNVIKEGDKIDVLILKEHPKNILKEIELGNIKEYFDWLTAKNQINTIVINEDDIERDLFGNPKRITYQYDDISDSSFKEQRLALGADFLKGVDKTDVIYLILH